LSGFLRNAQIFNIKESSELINARAVNVYAFKNYLQDDSKAKASESVRIIFTRIIHFHVKMLFQQVH